jgi:phosphate transport system substrate-binding protein
MKKTICIALALALTAVCLVGCSSGKSSSPSPSPSPSSSSGSPSSSGSSQGDQGSSDDPKKGVITVSGSTALQPLLTMAVGKFMTEKEYKGVVTVDGGGSGKGLTDVAAGKVDIGSSDVSPEQFKMEGTGLVDHQVAIVAVGVVVSPDVASNLMEISTADLKGIFTGEISDWKQVAGWKGVGTPITAFYHKAGSGIRYLFDTYGIAASLTEEQIGALKSLKLVESYGSFQNALETGKGTIGYAPLPYCNKLKMLKVDGSEASYENVYTGKYKIWGCGHLYTKGEATGAVKAFIEFLSSPDFGETVTKSGYGLISEMKVSR